MVKILLYNIIKILLKCRHWHIRVFLWLLPTHILGFAFVSSAVACCSMLCLWSFPSWFCLNFVGGLTLFVRFMLLQHTFVDIMTDFTKIIQEFRRYKSCETERYYLTYSVTQANYSFCFMYCIYYAELNEAIEISTLCPT
jgi:hypothetical protein